MPTVPPVRKCAAHTVNDRILREHPEFRSGREASVTDAIERAAHRVARTGVTTIPVVVHIVHNTDEQNISDAQIASQIDVLNRDFGMKNTDAAQTPAPFKPFVANPLIEFQLATADPDGNPTNGITRTRTTVAGFPPDDSVKSAATGGADAWPTDRYLNIWVCDLGSGLLGYAQFPGMPPETDGVVILYSAFGTIGTATAPFNLGRTATHEIGHWLNLFHIWGDDDGPGEDPCSGDDGIFDTPGQGTRSTGMPTFPQISCGNGPNGDMFMNYMDYTDDAGMFMFTHGQVSRMHAALDHDRPSIGVGGPVVPQPQVIPVPYPGRLLKFPPLTKGEDVRVWQQRMTERGFSLVVDGLYGKNSKAACLALQQQEGLQADGIVGPMTWEATFASTSTAAT
jgi:hypothetical protein